MGLMISKGGKLRDITLPSQRKVRHTREQNVEFDDVLHKERGEKERGEKERREKKEKREKQRTPSPSEEEQKREHHPSMSLSSGPKGLKGYNQSGRLQGNQRPSICAKEIGSSPVISIHPQQTVQEALRLMEHKGIHHLVLLNEDEILKGIVSDRDLLNQRAQDPVSQHAQSEVILTKESTELKVLAKLMLEKNISSLPFIDQNQVVTGIITKSDILSCLINNIPFETYV